MKHPTCHPPNMFNDIDDICWDFCDACRAGYGWENVDDIVCVCMSDLKKFNVK